ncbi:hypothetical protein KHA90_08980 [Flavobacterium psychroterrae]|uniref:MORN repeat variant n=1 Tax=Flavobacterium psychroterrae TaxID=2133767 RepID=A0ABS5PB78_9FLAO|nr:hypothetical protein [Flavobacterium psychroterrae]MBS7231158.1 hypothetical protein [Flavobacterium psychroterrae]
MKYLKLVIICCLTLFISFCKKDEKKTTSLIKKDLVQISITDTLINGIDSSKIVDLKKNKEKIIEIFFRSLDKDCIKPLINFNRVKNFKEKIEVKKYVNFYINNDEYQSYLISFFYENDELYRSILLTNSILDDGLLIYEKVLDEGEYLRTSKINKNFITNSIFKIEHFNYDKKGNISKELVKNDSLLVIKNNYLIQENYFLEYFNETNLSFNKEWGDKEIIYTKDGIDSSYVYLYEMKGKIKDHLKVGNWEERRYISEYDKSVWLSGKYVKGFKNGEWSYSPDGPVDKIEVYSMGKMIKTYYP